LNVTVQNCTHRLPTDTASQSITRRENPLAALEGNRANGSLKVKHVACIHSWPIAVLVGAAAVVQLVQVYHRDSGKPVQLRAAPRRLKYKPRPCPDAHPLPLCTATSLNLYYYCCFVLPARPRRVQIGEHGSAMEAALPQQLPFTSVVWGVIRFFLAGAAAVEGACRGAAMGVLAELCSPLTLSCACLFHSCC
jgi:hypothetical protein